MDYQGKIAVITGAANGIGRELAKDCFAKGMKLALADIDAENLANLAAELKTAGAELFISVFDVGSYDDMTAFAKAVYQQYGTVDYFFNNAGVAVVGNIWSMSLKDWKWGFDTNVMGLVHGIKAFVPAMIEQDKECRVINTASVAGLLISPNSPVYVASKHAAVALSEVFNMQLQLAGVKVKSHVYCPGFIVTDLHNSDRHRPAELINDTADPYYQSEDFLTKVQAMNDQVTNGIPVEKAINQLWQAIEEEKFYILTHPEYKPVIEAIMQNILNAM